MKKLVLTSVVLASGLALAGCSGDTQAQGESSNASPTASQTPSASATQETYKLDQAFAATTPDGAHITVDFTAEAPADVEAARTSLGAEPVSYAQVTVDNREGSDRVGAYPVTVYDEEGTTYEFNDLPNVIEDWEDGVNAEVYSKYLNENNIDPLEKGGGYLASLDTDLPETVTGVTIQAYGGDTDPIYLTPAPQNDLGGTETPAPSTPPATIPAPPQAAPKNALDMTPEEAMRAAASGQITLDEYCQRDSFFTSGDTQMCHFHNNPQEAAPAEPSGEFTYDEAYAAWQGGMSYWDAFCVNYTPTTPGGVSQCDGIQMGTVDHYTGEYIGDQGPATVPSFPPADGGDPYCNEDAQGNMHCYTPVPDSIQ